MIMPKNYYIKTKKAVGIGYRCVQKLWNGKYWYVIIKEYGEPHNNLLILMKQKFEELENIIKNKTNIESS